MKAKDQETLAFVKRYIEKHNYSPTLTEIAMAIGYTPTGARACVRRLVEGGHLCKAEGHKARTLSLPEK